MTLTPIKANMTEVQVNERLTILFSYRTPVACSIVLEDGKWHHIKTEKYWSKTTSRHINQWAGQAIKEIKPQEWFDNLTIEVK